MVSKWTPHEKRRLLYALYQYGPANIEALHEMVPTKTKSEIKVLCDKHKKLSLQRDQEKSQTPSVKLWLQLFKRLMVAKNHPSDLVPRVLKYIALFENRPPSKCINTKKCYLALANMSRGLDFEQLDETNNYFLFECLSKIAKSLKHDSRCARRYAESITSFKDLNKNRTNPKSKLQHSCTLNPLGIPDDLLQLTQDDLIQKNVKCEAINK